MEGIDKFFSLVFLALNYLQWQPAEQTKSGRKVKSFSQLIVEHGQPHFRALVEAIAQQAAQNKPTEQIIQFLKVLD